MDLLIILLRNFDTGMAKDPKDPAQEYQKLKDEILLTDFMVLEKRIEREAKEKKNPPEMPILKKLIATVEKNEFPKPEDYSQSDQKMAANYNFLSMKKRIVLINQEEGVVEIPAGLKKQLEADGVQYFSLSATLEKELVQLNPEEQLEFLKGFGLKESARNAFVPCALNALGLISFITSGEDEVRAWPFRKGSTAVETAEKIHTDIARGFIRAEVIAYEDFKKHGSEAECKKAGVYRLEGKEYIVKDGDIISFRFNV